MARTRPQSGIRNPSTSLRTGPKSGISKGLILIVVLWVFTGLSLFMYSFLHGARVEHRISAGSADRLRARALVNSAVEYTIAALFEDDSPADGPWDLWYDDRERFLNVAVNDPATGREGYGYFTVFKSDFLVDNIPLQYGPRDEAGKINLNTATREMLLDLTPRMTDAIVDAILDWRDTDEIPGSAGAENNYYLGLAEPYRCKDGPFETVEELLYVRNVNAMVLYGEDWNRNGMLDPNEDDGAETDPPDNGDGRLETGLWHLCTVYSFDPNISEDGQPRVNINTASLPELQSVLGDKVNEDQVRQIVVGRINGNYPSVAALLFLPNWDNASFQAVADFVTIVDTETIPGLVNVNTAPRDVLVALPGMTEDLADAVVTMRGQSTEPLDNIGWLLNVMDRTAFSQIANFITVHTNQYAIQAVGWVPNTRGLPPVYSRIWTVIDMSVTPPRALALKDLTPLGFPYPLEDVVGEKEEPGSLRGAPLDSRMGR